MAFPVVKVLIVSFRYACRPLNNLLIKSLKARGPQSKFRQLFIRVGQMAHVYEFNLNRYVIEGTSETEGLKRILKPLSSDAAFNKGVDYFSEIFFFYGLLMLVAIYEIRKSHLSSEAAKAKLLQNTNDVSTISTDIEQLQELLKQANQAKVTNYRMLEHINDEMKSMDKSSKSDVRYNAFGLGAKTPMIELQSLSDGSGCKILAKCEHLNPSARPLDRFVAQAMKSIAFLPELKRVEMNAVVKRYNQKEFVTEEDDNELLRQMKEIVTDGSALDIAS